MANQQQTALEAEPPALAVLPALRAEVTLLLDSAGNPGST
jgi:hypothetical protein